MKLHQKVIHVELRKPHDGRKHFYFGSCAAIYAYLPEEVVGVKLETLWNYDLSSGEYSNKHATIREGRLMRKRGNRGINKQIKP